MATDPRLDVAMKYYHANLDQEAWTALQDILRDPAPALPALRFAATLRFEARALDEAIGFCDQCLAREPHDAHTLLLKGRALLDLGRTDAAVAALCEAVAAEPTRPASHFNLGLALERQGKLSEAEAAYRRAVTLQDVYPVAWNNLGNVLDQLGRPGEALAALETAIAQLPQFSMAHNNLGIVLAGQGRFSAAAKAHGDALRFDPDNIAAAVNLGVADIERGLVDQGLKRLDDVLAKEPGHTAAHDNRLFSIHYLEDNPAKLFLAHQAWGLGQSSPPRPRVIEPDPNRRLRVGYVSPDFRRHSVSFFIEPLLAAHDRRAVEVICYSNVAHGDEVTAKLRALADQWRDIAGLGAASVVEMIQRDRIDILVDLAGHTLGNRLDVFAARAAPIQVTGIGYPDTTGLPSMDARLCDDVTDPMDQADRFATERLERIAQGLHCYAPPGDAPDVGPLPAMANNAVTFGSFNKLAKISPATIRLWAEVLKQIPGSRLLLKTKPLAERETQDLFIEKFTAAGVHPDRLDLIGWNPDDRGHLATYARVDIALDPTPYNGTTTTCEALWMGVPVLTPAGQAHAGRVGASLLSCVGLSDWIARDDDDFVRKAVHWASRRQALADLRQNLRTKVAQSRLCDAKSYARDVEGIYRRLWRQRYARV
ncbi:MAG: tetratricopeptide repeat protein [Rhodospirillaceae bacterium]|nr:tetratricopeptide repeat protein [Rhodospirillaceae bacterium]